MAERKIPLKVRKNIKTADPKIQEQVEHISKSFGKSLIWDDNSDEIYNALENYSEGKGEDIGDKMVEYVSQLNKCIAEFVKNPDNKESLEQFLTGGKIGIKIIDSSETEQYFKLIDGSLYMESKANYWGSYISYFNPEYLEKILTLEHNSTKMTLVAKRNLNDSLPKIEKSLAGLSKAFGKPITLDDNFGEIYTALETYSQGRGEDLGAKLLEYVNQAVACVTGFIKDEDNKEALEEEWSSGKLRVAIIDSSVSDQYWRIVDGVLQMESKANYWGSYMSYFNEEYLEKLF